MIRYTYKILFLCQLLYHGLSKCGRERAKNLWETDAVSEDNDSLVMTPTDDGLSKFPTNYIPIYTVFSSSSVSLPNTRFLDNFATSSRSGVYELKAAFPLSYPTFCLAKHA